MSDKTPLQVRSIHITLRFSELPVLDVAADTKFTTVRSQAKYHRVIEGSRAQPLLDELILEIGKAFGKQDFITLLQESDIIYGAKEGV